MKRNVFVGISLLLAVAASVRLSTQGPSPLTVDTVLEHWAVGESRTYRLEWNQSQSTQAAVGAERQVLGGEMSLTAELSLTRIQSSAAAPSILISIERLLRFDATLMGQPLPSDGVEGGRAAVVLDATAGVKHLRFSEEEPVLNRYLFQALAQEMFPPLPGTREHRFVERMAAGEAESVTYWLNPQRTDLIRRRERYRTLKLSPNTPASIEVDSESRFSFEKSGKLQTVSFREEVAGANGAGRPVVAWVQGLELKATGSRAADGAFPALEALSVVREPGVSGAEIDLDRALLESRVGSMSFDAMARTLTEIENPRAIPNRSRFVYEASGYLELYPRACERLGELFAGLRSDAMRAQLVDLLVSAGSEAAQRALRRILAADAVALDRSVYEQLYQRLGMVSSPSPESVQWVLDGHAEALHAGDHAQRRVRAFTAGSMAHAIRSKEPELARVIGDVLLDDLDLATDTEERHVALRALGNAGDPRAIDAARAWITSDDASVRAGAATALRRLDAPDAKDVVLTGLEQERSRIGQAAMLDALRGRLLDAEDFQLIRDVVVEGRLARGAERMLLMVLNEAKTASPETIQTLQSIVATPSVPATYRVQARSLLARFTM